MDAISPAEGEDSNDVLLQAELNLHPKKKCQYEITLTPKVGSQSRPILLILKFEYVSPFFGCINSFPPSAVYIDGLVQDCSNSIAKALELLQSCTKPSIYASMN